MAEVVAGIACSHVPFMASPKQWDRLPDADPLAGHKTTHREHYDRGVRAAAYTNAELMRSSLCGEPGRGVRAIGLSASTTVRPEPSAPGTPSRPPRGASCGRSTTT